MSRIIRTDKSGYVGNMQIVSKSYLNDGKNLVAIKSEGPIYFENNGEIVALNRLGDFSYIPCFVLHNKEKSFACIIDGVRQSIYLNESDWIDDDTYSRFKSMDSFDKASDVFIDSVKFGGTVDVVVPLVLEDSLVLNKPTTILLNHDISSKKSGLVIESDVVIEGNGKLIAGSGGGYTAIRANSGNLTIKSGDFFVGGDENEQGNSCVYANGDAVVVIEGGRFETAKSYPHGGKDFFYVLNLKNGSNASIQCKGGTFVNYNPADGDDEMGGSFVAPGYKSVQTGENIWTVVPE